RVSPHDSFHDRTGDACAQHGLGGFWHLEWITHAPVGGAVDDHAFCAELFDDFDHPRLVHLGVGVDGVTRPTATIEGDAYRLFVVVIDEHHARIDSHLFDDRNRTL